MLRVQKGRSGRHIHFFSAATAEKPSAPPLAGKSVGKISSIVRLSLNARADLPAAVRVVSPLGGKPGFCLEEAKASALVSLSKPPQK